jgi:hypothetical protein
MARGGERGEGGSARARGTSVWRGGTCLVEADHVASGGGRDVGVEGAEGVLEGGREAHGPQEEHVRVQQQHPRPAPPRQHHLPPHPVERPRVAAAPRPSESVLADGSER